MNKFQTHVDLKFIVQVLTPAQMGSETYVTSDNRVMLTHLVDFIERPKLVRKTEIETVHKIIIKLGGQQKIKFLINLIM